jgi:mannitol 2-dehydrogenase
MTKLSDATLSTLPPELIPRYDRGSLSRGVVHFGVGGFHRSHQAWYLGRLMDAGLAADWAVCGVGVLPGDRAMQAALLPQDCLYALIAKHPDGAWDPRVVGSIVEYLFAPDDPAAVLARLTDPGTRIVTLTITEGGYHLDDAGAVANDVRHPDRPGTVFGLIARGLELRRARGLAPFTVLSCDNAPDNGHLARRTIADFAALRDRGLADWIRDEVAFPSSMVDRITPATTADDQARLAADTGIEDAWPVVCEPFTQWVVEDVFPAGRPPLDRVGVQFTADVRPYESMKLRLLNAGHQVLAYLGLLCGHRYVDEACRDPLLARFLRDYLAVEARPTLDPVPGVDLDGYCEQLLRRFGSPYIRDTLARQTVDASERIPKFLLPVVRDQLRLGGPVERAAAVVAAWARFWEGTDESGRPFELVDVRHDGLKAAAARQRVDPLAFLADRTIFGDLAEAPRFVEAYRRALGLLHERGARATLRELTEAATDQGR